MTDGQGFAAVCDEHGVVREVIRDTLGFAIGPGADITGIVDADDRDKCRRFLATALSRQAAFDWSLNVPYRDRLLTLHFGAANMDGQLVIIAAESRTDLARLSLELARDTRGATAQLRRVLRESARQLESRADHDAHLYDELTRLNNELTGTQRRLIKANAELTRANEELRAFYAALPLGVFRTDLQGRVVQANETFAAVTGGGTGDLWFAHAHPDDLGELERRWQEASHAGSGLESLHRRSGAGERSVHVDCRLVPLHDEDRRPAGFVGVVEDVSEWVAGERRAMELERHRAVRDVTAGLAHNLNNDMAVILGSAELIADEVPSDHPLRDSVQMNITATQHAAALTRRLMMYSGIAIGMAEPVRADEALLRVAERYRADLADTQTLTLELNSGDGIVRVDRNMFSDAVGELVANALAAIDGHGEISLSSGVVAPGDDMPGPQLVVTVADNGAGMSAETVGQARTPFFTTRGVGEGIGLGLSFADGFARMYGGELLIKSRVGQGTRVRLKLPLAEA